MTGVQTCALPISPMSKLKTTTNFALDAGVLGLIIRVGEVLDFNIRALFEAINSLLKASDCKVGLQAY